MATHLHNHSVGADQLIRLFCIPNTDKVIGWCGRWGERGAVVCNSAASAMPVQTLCTIGADEHVKIWGKKSDGCNAMPLMRPQKTHEYNSAHRRHSPQQNPQEVENRKN